MKKLIAISIALACASSASASMSVQEMLELVTLQRQEILEETHNKVKWELKAETAEARRKEGGDSNSGNDAPSGQYGDFNSNIEGGISFEGDFDEKSDASMKLVEVRDKYAYISLNGTLSKYKKGDMIDGAEVISVSADSIEFVKDGVNSVLKIEW